jgi:hypothetical protein
MSNQLHNLKMLKILAEQEIDNINKHVKLIEREMAELQKMYQQSLIRIKELTEEANDARKDSKLQQD